MARSYVIGCFIALVAWSCAEKSSITEITSSPQKVLSTYVVNGNGKATIAWETPNDGAPQQYAVYRDTVRQFSSLTAVRIRTVQSYPLGGVTDAPLTNGKVYYYAVVSENIGSLGTIVQANPANTAPARPNDYSSIATADIKFSQHIQPILLSGCAVSGCHVGADAGGRFSLLTWEDAVKGDGGVSVIVPFKATKSDIVRHLNRDTLIAPTASPQMPRPDLALPADQMNLLIRWVDNGAMNDDGSVARSAIPARGRAYVTNQGEDLVAVIDMDDNVVMRFITAGVANTQLQPPQSPHNIIVDMQNQFYYVNLVGGSKLLKYKVSDNSKVGELATGITSPAQVALSQGGDTAYVTNFFGLSNGITVVNTRTMSVISPVSDPRMKQPHGATVTHDYKYAIVTNYLSDNVTVIQTSDNSVVDVVRLSGSVPVIPAGATQFQPYQSVVSLDNKFAYVSCSQSNEVRVIDLTLLKVVDSIKVGTKPLVPDITPDGKFIYVACRNSNSVSVIRTSDHAVVATIANVGVEPHGLGISRDGKYAYVACENLDGTDEPHHPTVGGKRIGTVQVIDIATNTIIRELEVGNFAAGVAVLH